ncbi:uncharacterized protein VTP21DRAFT_1684 [Calcarisporiella thermophila]|uniref:uncharacterized protein n=1 Tax=Calcarisporiella thermophila TaxID=911321 RepID=UPI003743D999
MPTSKTIDFKLLETILYEPGKGFYLLDRHFNRLLASAQFFEINAPSSNKIEKEMQERVKQHGDIPQKVRVLVDKTGGLIVEAYPLIANARTDPTIVLDTQPVSSEDIFLRHKTTHRPYYERARARADVPATYQDVVLYNERGEITETSICNIAVEMEDGTWITPSVECGCLAGTMRSELLEKGEIQCGIVTVVELAKASKEGRGIKIFNSVSGIMNVQLDLKS